MPRRVPVQVLPGCRRRIPVAELRRVARHVLDHESVDPAVEVEVVLADAETVHELNRLYRGQDEPTDVLAFATLDAPIADAEFVAPTVAFLEPPDTTPSLGEIVVCLPVAESQAEAGGRAVAGEIAHLLVHGLLHLLGYDHEVAADSARMQSREDELLADLGYAGAYEHGH